MNSGLSTVFAGSRFANEVDGIMRSMDETKSRSGCGAAVVIDVG